MKKRLLLATSILVAGGGLALAEPPAKAPMPAIASPNAPVVAPAATTSLPSGAIVTEDGNVIMQGQPASFSLAEGFGFEPWLSNRIWVEGSYFLGWVDPGPNGTPLVTTGPDFADTPGAIGQPGTKILYGRGTIDYGAFSGLKIGGGYWLDDVQTKAIEVRALILEKKSQPEVIRSTELGEPFLLRPFFNDETEAQDVAILAFPGLVRGQIQITNSTEFWGAEINMLSNWKRGSMGRIDVIYGFRYLQLNEKLRIDEYYQPLDEEDNEISFLGEGFEFPNAVYVFDQFKTRNQFYGFNMGAKAELNFGSFYIDARGQVALGTTHSKVMIKGGSYLYDNQTGEALASANGGLLALPSNIGSRDTNAFAVVPSIELRAGYWLTEGFQVYVGYNFVYWSQVLRPNDQIDFTLDPRQVPTFDEYDANVVGQRPRQPLKGTDFWVQGVEFGVQWRY